MKWTLGISALMVVLETLAVVFHWSPLAASLCRTGPFCILLLVVGFAHRPLLKADAQTVLLGVFAGSVLMALLLDLSKSLEFMRAVPVFGAESPVRRNIQGILMMLALFGFFGGSCHALDRIRQAREGLSAETARLKTVETAFQRQTAMDALVANLSSRLGSCRVDSVQDVVNESLERAGQFTSVDAVLVAYASSGGARWTISHRWEREAARSDSQWQGLDALVSDGCAWSRDRLEHGESVPMDSLAVWPEEAEVERRWARALGIESALKLPLRGQDAAVKGCMCFLASSGSIQWREEDVHRLRLIGDSIANALERKRSEDGRVALEAQLRQSQKMEALGQLAGGVAHDFNNLLTVINAHTSILQQDTHVRGECAESLRGIVQASDRAANLTRQLLTFSRRQAMRPQNIDLNEVAETMTRMLKRLIGEDITLYTELRAVNSRISADPGMMEQVLANLVVNARDAMPRGGQLVLRTSEAHLDDLDVTPRPGARAGDFVELTLTDSGCGIAPEHLPHIFEPFFTTKPAGKGTGLGLAMVFGIVEQHQGWVEVDSVVGTGTSFRIYFPRLIGAPERSAPSDMEVASVLGNETVLVVEDEAPVRRLARVGLARYGYRVLEAESGPAGLRVWDSHEGSIDLLLADLVMPGGMSGVELASALQARRKDLKVIFTTGYSPEAAGRVLAGVDPEKMVLLRKPYGPRELAGAIRDVLDGRAVEHLRV